MQTETGVVEGPITVTDEYVLTGIAKKGITVRSGARLVMTGITKGGITVERDAAASVTGIVNGGVRNRGYVRLTGIVNGSLINEDGATADIEPGSYIDGVKQ